MKRMLRTWGPALLALLGAALVAGACGGGGSDPYGEKNPVEVSGTSIRVEMTDILFQPRSVKVKPGTTVTWVNKDPVVHNVRNFQSAFLSPDVEPGDTFSFTFDEPGNYRYECTYHPPNMIGVVIVEE